MTRTGLQVCGCVWVYLCCVVICGECVGVRVVCCCGFGVSVSVSTCGGRCVCGV